MAVLDVLRPPQAYDDLPVVVIVTASEVHRHLGRLLADVRRGVHVRVDDIRDGERSSVWLSSEMPASVAAVARLASLPNVGEAADLAAPDGP
jgi:hypothetical protein